MTKITETKIDQLIQDDKNLNKGTEQGKRLITKSLSEFGAGRSVLIDKNNRIIAGNKTHENAKEIGMEDVIVVETDGTKLVAVKRTDVDLDSKQGREMSLADDATVKVDLEWDTDAMNDVAEDWGIEVGEWGVEMMTPDEEPNDDELSEWKEDKPFSLKITFLNKEELDKFRTKYESLIEDEFSVTISVSAGKL